MPEFTKLYELTRQLLDEIGQAKNGLLNRGDVRALSMAIMRDVPGLPLRSVAEMDKYQQLRLKTLLQRTFRALAQFDPQVVAHDDEEDLVVLKDAFTAGLKRLLGAAKEALPTESIVLRVLLLSSVLTCAIILYNVWQCSSISLWNSTIMSRGSGNIKSGGEATFTNSSYSFLPLQQQLQFYKLEMNMTAYFYEDCDDMVTQAVDLVLRRIAKLSTDLQMVPLTIWVSKFRALKPFFQLFNIASETSLQLTVLELYESYLSETETAMSRASGVTEELKNSLTTLETNLRHTQQASDGNLPLDLTKFIHNIVDLPAALFRGKKHRAVLNPDILAQLHLRNDHVRVLAERYVFELFDELKSLQKVVSDQPGADKPVQESIDEILTATAKLRNAKKPALLIKSILESNGTVREANSAIWKL